MNEGLFFARARPLSADVRSLVKAQLYLAFYENHDGGLQPYPQQQKRTQLHPPVISCESMSAQLLSHIEPSLGIR